MEMPLLSGRELNVLPHTGPPVGPIQLLRQSGVFVADRIVELQLVQEFWVLAVRPDEVSPGEVHATEVALVRLAPRR
jgi:hypothetical protein